MIYTPMTKKAMTLMFEKHKNQMDKSGEPYVFHPFHVAEQMDDENTTIVGLLHDIVEDTDVTFADLEKMGFSNEVITALKFMTHTENVDYFDYVKKIGTNPIARKVKLKDLEHNMDLTRLNEVTDNDLKRVEKYQICHDYLEAIDKRENLQRNQGNEMKKINFEETSKTIDGMFGLAIADAVGVPVEFKSRTQLKNNPLTDMVGYGTHQQPPGTWSDDSSMAIATMDSINECESVDYTDIMKKFSEWVTQSKYTATGDFFDIGITTSNAIHNFREGINPVLCGENNIRSNGNGSLMRILPVVLYSYYNNLSDEEDIELINNTSSLTHAHEISRLGCKIYSDYLKKILSGKSKEQAYNELSANSYEKDYSKESIDYYKRMFDGSLANVEESEINSSGFVVDTLEASIWANLTSNNYQEAVLKAVNLGDDTDTVGAVTGSIAGILYGYENIPKKWRDNLKSKEYLEEICKDFDKVIEKQKESQVTY